MAKNNKPVKEKPIGLEHVYKNPRTGTTYFVTRSNLNPADRRGYYSLTNEKYITDWRYVVPDIPFGYWVDIPRKGKPMLKKYKVNR